MKELYPKAQAVPRPKWLSPFGLVTLVVFIAIQVLAFRNSVPDALMGNLQKIMYVHVPAAWASMVAFFVVFVMSIAYLFTKRVSHDLLAAAAAEVGVLMTGLTLLLGSIWGKPTWGTFWTWDPRLTATAIMMLMYIGYLTLRGFTDEEEKRGRWSAAVGILAFLNVPIVFWSVNWWRSLHQTQLTRQSTNSEYLTWLWLNGLAFLFVLIFFIASRYHVAQLERAVEMRLEAEALAGSDRHV